jgi:NH3-dependent NAD+ synthetase
MTTLRILSSVTLALALVATGCGDKKKSDAGKTTESGSTAEKKSGTDLSGLQAQIDAAKTKDDIDAAFDKCMSTAIDMAINGIKEPDKDPAYRATCKYGFAKKRAALVIADSTPDKMNVMCLSASMQLEELGGEGGPEAEEMKKLEADVNKACGL